MKISIVVEREGRASVTYTRNFPDELMTDIYDFSQNVSCRELIMAQVALKSTAEDAALVPEIREMFKP